MVAAAPVVALSDEDLEVVAKVLAQIKDPLAQKQVDKVIEPFGKYLLVVPYAVLRGAGLSPELAGLVIAAREKHRQFLRSKLSWEKILGSDVLSKDQLDRLDTLLDATLFHLLDSQLLTDCQVPHHIQPRVLQSIDIASKKF